ncbi:hypothetical protein BZG02_18680 [Labilibaculum filiforme]|uniref:Uncharacterized protein n=1 Tax=Labilibaculum filiforme TaxID=1940526 RepID=A0A2N3HRG5_9BACT|nr:hypothetical protein BZG02_18680 [Labilibaculum filiforme]
MDITISSERIEVLCLQLDACLCIVASSVNPERQKKCLFQDAIQEVPKGMKGEEIKECRTQ